jgi:(5-formylfuran-3-yl)methyl phosphate synthase
MIKLRHESQFPGLLVSVRNSVEAVTALVAGADVIDVKEPSAGPLGSADRHVIAEIVQAIEGRALVTAAMGELVDLTEANGTTELAPLAAGVSLFKIGLAGCGSKPDWQTHWRDSIAALIGNPKGNSPEAVAVVYADWRAANAPKPNDVLTTGAELGCPALLIDTWNKSAGTLFDIWPVDELRAFLKRVCDRRLAVVLAGSLTGDNIAQAVALGPELVAVRGAACNEGRGGVISAARVRALKHAVAECAIPRRFSQTVRS